MGAAHRSKSNMQQASMQLALAVFPDALFVAGLSSCMFACPLHVETLRPAFAARMVLFLFCVPIGALLDGDGARSLAHS